MKRQVTSDFYGFTHSSGEESGPIVTVAEICLAKRNIMRFMGASFNINLS